MSEHPHDVRGSKEEPLVEDVSLRGIVAFTLALVLLIVVSAVATYFLTVELRDRERAQDPEPSPIARETEAAGLRSEPPAPRLQPQPKEPTSLVDQAIAPDPKTAPNVEMSRYLAVEEEELNSYGWVDRVNGIARIPIDRAMDKLVEQGLPETPREPEVDTTDQEGADG